MATSRVITKVSVLFVAVIVTSVVITFRNSTYQVNVTHVKTSPEIIQNKHKAHLQNIAIHLSKVVTSTWRTPEAQIEARKALALTQTVLAEYGIEYSSNDINQMKNESRYRTKEQLLAVCPEKYLGTHTDYPFFEKGRVLTNCSNAPPFPSVISILLNGFDYAKESQIIVVLREIYATYPNLTVHLAVAEKVVIPDAVKLDIRQHIFGSSSAANDVWNGLAKKPTTDYVLVGRRIERFQWYALLERMVRVLSELGVDAVGGGLRTPDGHWSMGCQQMRLRNYTFTYRNGYHMSTNSCAYCDYIPSPFVSKTSTLRDVKFEMTSPDTVFYDYFLRLQKDRKLTMSCPDAMFYVLANNETASHLHKQWTPMVQKYAVNHVNFADGRHLSYSCDEAKTSFTWTAGLIVPVCAVETLLKGVHDAMDICEKIGLFCHLDGGTTMGAMKFNGILPWERDADISYVRSNNISFMDHRDKFTKLGYRFTLRYPDKCQKFNLSNEYCGMYSMNIPHWRIEINGDTTRVMTDFLRENRLEPTKLFIGGRWMTAPTNPALTLRNRYGYELLKHVEHYISLRHKSQWDEYTGGSYKKCPTPGSHVCLDQQYPVDGNVDFIYQ